MKPDLLFMRPLMKSNKTFRQFKLKNINEKIKKLILFENKFILNQFFNFLINAYFKKLSFGYRYGYGHPIS